MQQTAMVEEQAETTSKVAMETGSEDISKEDKKAKKKRKKEKKERKAAKKRELEEEKEKEDTTTNECKSKEDDGDKKERKSSKKRKLNKKDEDSNDEAAADSTESKPTEDVIDKTEQDDPNNKEEIKALEKAYQKALKAFKADKTNKDLRRAKTAAKKAWDAAVIAAAGPDADAIVCRNCSQLFVFKDQEKFKERKWDKPSQCKNCVGKDILKSQDRSKLDQKQNMCYEFQKTGTCSRGERCKFSHATQHVGKKLKEKLAARPLCRSIEKGETCPHGDKCRFRHEVQVQA